MTNTQTPDIQWFKSSYSEGSGNACVEVAFVPESIRIRDSKDTTLPSLSVTGPAWSSFIGEVTR